MYLLSSFISCSVLSFLDSAFFLYSWRFSSIFDIILSKSFFFPNNSTASSRSLYNLFFSFNSFCFSSSNASLSLTFSFLAFTSFSFLGLDSTFFSFLLSFLGFSDSSLLAISHLSLFLSPKIVLFSSLILIFSSEDKFSPLLELFLLLNFAFLLARLYLSSSLDFALL